MPKFGEKNSIRDLFLSITIVFPLKPECVECCGIRFRITFESHDSAGLLFYYFLLLLLLLITLLGEDGCQLVTARWA